MKRIVILGGSFFALGNVNPAAEANVSGGFMSFFTAFRLQRQTKMAFGFSVYVLQMVVCVYYV